VNYDLANLQADCQLHELEGLAQTATELYQLKLKEHRHGDLDRWQQVLAALPDMGVVHHNFDQAAIQLASEKVLSQQQQILFKQNLMQLRPWRKGPFDLFDIKIDTEWRSDWKWDRLIPHIRPLNGKRVLDIGCGNAYHGWRMRGAGAELVVGVDPTLLYFIQFQLVKHYLPHEPVYLLPGRIEDLPARLPQFDTVFSMGVLYHRQSPFEHLFALKEYLKPGGQLVLETLIIEGGEGQVLVPAGRYAKMRNVWFLPSVDTLIGWMQRAGYKSVHCVDQNQTSLQEQRSTDWMRFESLVNFLAADDQNKTIEGLPAPRRAIFVAEV